LDVEPIEHKVGRRSKMEMLCDVLKVVSQGVHKPTRIMQVANFTWNDLITYLEALIRSGLLVKEGGPRTTYLLTEKGRSVLSTYLSLKEGLAHAELDTITKENMMKALKLRVATQTDESVVRELESRLTEAGLHTERNRVVGESGEEQVFDIVAKAKNGSTFGYMVLKDVDELHVLGLFVKQLDTGLDVRAVYTGEVSPEARTLASSYSIRLEKWEGEAMPKNNGESKLDLLSFAGKRILFQVDPNTRYETVVRKAASDFLGQGQRVLCFTWKGSPIYEAVSGLAGLFLYTMTSEVSYTKAVPGKGEFLVPQSDQAVLLEELRKANEAAPKAGVLVIIDSISDLLLLNGVQHTYEFLRKEREVLTGAKVTTLSILRLQSQDPKTDSLIKGIYTTHLLYDSEGLRTTR